MPRTVAVLSRWDDASSLVGLNVLKIRYFVAVLDSLCGNQLLHACGEQNNNNQNCCVKMHISSL